MTTIEPLDPADDEQFAVFHATYAAAQVEQWDRPNSALEQRVEFLKKTGYYEQIGLLASDDGAPVGVGIVEIPLKDNPTLAYVSVHVLPDCRRRGHGSALLDALAGIARENVRTSLFAEARWNGDQTGSGHTAFAEARGFHSDLVDAHRVLDLPATLPDAPARDGYTLHTWRGPCPGEWADQYANLLMLITQEAPSGDFDLQNEFYDAARVRTEEESLVIREI